MKVKNKLRRRRSEADAELSQIPRKFICIDPAQKHLVFDFLSDFNHDLRETALVHLRLCLHCCEVAQTVLKIKSGHCLHAAQSEVEVKESSHPLTIEGEHASYAPASEADTEVDFCT